MSTHRQHTRPFTRPARRVLAVAVLLLSAGWAGCRDKSCSIDEHNDSVFRLMQQYYFFNGEADQRAKYLSANPASFPHPDAVLDYLRYRPETHDRGFSYITTPRIEQDFIDAGVFVGFGVGLTSPSEGELFIRLVEPGSPAARAGFARGDEVLEIDDRTIAELDAANEVGFAFGPPRAGVSVTFLIEKGDGSGQIERTLVKEAITTDVVSDDWGIFDVGGEDVGYLLFHSFIPPAIGELRDIFQEFAAEGVTKLVVDLRYNGGGHLRIAESIINVLGGDGNEGELQYTARFSSSDGAPHEDVAFGVDPDTFPVDTIAFITTDRSASASELLVNALAPYRNVLVVGDTTFGKPVGQGAVDYCYGEYRLRIVAFDLVNSEGEGGYYDGIDPTCPAVDDLGHGLGDPNEASLATALTAAATGACPVTATHAARAPSPPRTPGWLGPTPVPWLDVY